MKVKVDWDEAQEIGCQIVAWLFIALALVAPCLIALALVRLVFWLFFGLDGC